MNEKRILELVSELEDRGEYNKAIEYLDEILKNIPCSYHALFLKYRVNKKRGFADRRLLQKALREANIQDASTDVTELMEKELDKLNHTVNPSNEVSNVLILEKIRKIEALIEGAKSEGERDAAINAKQRLEEKRHDELYEKEADDIIEYNISTPDMWHKRLFMALCRKHHSEPYRYYRQKHTTVMVRISKQYLDKVLWKEYLDYSKQLSSLIDDITDEIISKIHNYEEEKIIMGEIEHK